MNVMFQDCQQNNITLSNNETIIKECLFSHYLDNDDIMQNINFNNFRFASEAPISYANGVPQGKTDLKVFSKSNFSHRKKYFMIECKRLDGNKTLNRKYIKEGICHFIGAEPEYSSEYKRHFMLGFLVRNINIGENVEKINSLIKDDLHTTILPNTYESSYGKEQIEIILLHTFIYCTSIIS